MNQYNNSDELMHYGVLGMKWGVTRATKKLNAAKSSGDKRKQEKALNSLSSHRTKITKKINKLDKTNVKLEQRNFKDVTKNDTKAAKYELKAAKLQKKSLKTWSNDKSIKYERKAKYLSIKATELRAKSAETKAKIAQNEVLKKKFNQTLSSVDAMLVANGRKFAS